MKHPDMSPEETKAITGISHKPHGKIGKYLKEIVTMERSLKIYVQIVAIHRYID